MDTSSLVRALSVDLSFHLFSFKIRWLFVFSTQIFLLSNLSLIVFDKPFSLGEIMIDHKKDFRRKREVVD